MTNPAPLYLITYDYFNNRLRRRMTGVHDLETHTRDFVVKEIASNYVTGVQHIYECNAEGAGSCADITAEIATAVGERLFSEGEPVSHDLFEWLHKMHPAGVRSTRGLVEEAV